MDFEIDVRDVCVVEPYLNDTNWCEIPGVTIVWGNGDTVTGTLVVTKANHSAPGEGKQKFSYSGKLRRRHRSR